MKAAKVIFILLDGLNFSAAQTRMCYLSALVEAGRAKAFRLMSQMPPLSRPIYATFLTGMTPIRHGIMRNEDFRTLPQPNLFTLLAKANCRCCAAAFAWFFELAQGLAFDRSRHRYWHSVAGPIHNGIFYASDAYPDAELFADAEVLRKRNDPDFLLAHSMGIDFAGHAHGASSRNYYAAVQESDSLLAQYMPDWLDRGYSIIIASDHGMDDGGNHYSNAESVQSVPLWLAGDNWPEIDEIRQTDIYNFVTAMLT